MKQNDFNLFRRENGIKIKTIADELGYSIFNIYKFEQGLNNNARIYNWYIQHGFLGYLLKHEGGIDYNGDN